MRRRMALHNVAMRGDVAKITTLVAQGMDVDAMDHTGWSPLHTAAYVGDVEAVKTLVALGANKEMKSTESESTPLHLASQNGHVEATKTLVALGANKEARSAVGATPPHAAAGVRVDAAGGRHDAQRLSVRRAA